MLADKVMCSRNGELLLERRPMGMAAPTVEVYVPDPSDLPYPARLSINPEGVLQVLSGDGVVWAANGNITLRSVPGRAFRSTPEFGPGISGFPPAAPTMPIPAETLLMRGHRYADPASGRYLMFRNDCVLASIAPRIEPNIGNAMENSFPRDFRFDVP